MQQLPTIGAKAFRENELESLFMPPSPHFLGIRGFAENPEGSKGWGEGPTNDHRNPARTKPHPRAD